MERKYYLDNIRWITVILVMIYHVVYIFNSQGVISNFGIQGIEVLDNFLYIVYPWFMALLFVVAGVSARYSLNKRSGKQFALDRTLRLLVPSIVIMFAIGWICGRITNYYNDIFEGNGDMIPGVFKYMIYCFSGIGPLWFARQLYIASLVLLLIRAIDRKKKLEELCSRIKWWGFLILFISFFLSAQILNTPLIEVYRHGIYIFSFLIGYYVFYNNNVIEGLSKCARFLVPAAVLLAIVDVVYINIFICPKATDNILTTVNYCSKSVLKNPLTNLYAFVFILAVFSIAPKLLNFNNAFSRYMTKANFGFYVLHYYTLVVTAFICLEFLHLPIWACYIVDLFGMTLLAFLLYEIIRRIPIVRSLVLGLPYRMRKKEN